MFCLFILTFFCGSTQPAWGVPVSSACNIVSGSGGLQPPMNALHYLLWYDQTNLINFCIFFFNMPKYKMMLCCIQQQNICCLIWSQVKRKSSPFWLNLLVARKDFHFQNSFFLKDIFTPVEGKHFWHPMHIFNTIFMWNVKIVHKMHPWAASLSRF